MSYQPDFRYSPGNVVQLSPGSPASTVVWRGTTWVPHPLGAWRANVYMLDNGHWDCYFEDELYSVWRW